jgi:hypothetical protein
MGSKDLCVDEQVSKTIDIASGATASIIDCELEQTFRSIDGSSDEVDKHQQCSLLVVCTVSPIRK